MMPMVTSTTAALPCGQPPSSTGRSDGADIAELAEQGGLELLIMTSGRMFVTAKRHFRSLAPVQVGPTDVTCVIGGMAAPCGLRKVDQGYLLVGECYVQGLISGEGMMPAFGGMEKLTIR